MGIDTDAGTIIDKVETWIEGLIRLVPNLVSAAVILLVFYLVARAVSYGVSRTLARHGRPTLANVGAALLRWSIMIMAFLLAATIVLPSLRPGDLLSGLGIGSVAIGFTFKDILQNLLSGVLILLRQPFRVGDQIVVNGFEGTVEDIETRATFIKTYDGRRVIIPNAQIYTGTLTVNTAFDLRRSEYDIGIGCNDDWDKAMELMVEAARQCEGVLSDPAPEAIPVGIDAYQNTIRLRWWTKPERIDVIRTQGRVIVAVYKALDRAGIDMPYPTQVQLWHDQTKVTDGDRRLQREGWPAGQGDVPRPRWQPAKDG
ncbi:mechanosensitive ion channel family protein [Paracoccus aestuarii]|uniref:Small-conductance mechanosensitive channel n=1 Tax=Paracoccus aestuarii TaxID=453842 RepID=A0A418ZXV2_9RHOB|nr:mechanosensitive ion channel family protein [Paracoccus aestuarii]RJL05325.1 mechanosensitive ion channel family protein [Paracoccus aestuarii]WCR00424.1 mechanosensitive ion channel family protein [Paracoccus aestuarii]